MSAAEEIAKARALLEANRDAHREEPGIGLEALADKNPELRARVDKLRETLPMPASREPETTTEDGESA